MPINVNKLKEYKEQLERFRANWSSHIAQNYISNEEERNNNLEIKSSISHFIFSVSENKNIAENDVALLINEAIIVLAEQSGCQEDLEISEEILADLESKGIIDQSHYDLFYNKSSSSRWY